MLVRDFVHEGERGSNLSFGSQWDEKGRFLRAAVYMYIYIYIYLCIFTDSLVTKNPA